MKINRRFRIQTSLAAAILLSAVVLGGMGCQSFTLTKEEFEMQQRGGVADPEVGSAVGVVGTAGYIGTAIGAAVAGVK